MASATRHIWSNFAAFWKSQVFWGLVAAMILLTWQHFTGRLSGSLRQNLWPVAIPYVGILGIFLVLNAGHAIFRTEWRALRRKDHDEHRAGRKAELERSKPVIPNPNLQFRRFITDREWFGNEISGHACDAVSVEIGNDLLSDRAVGHAKSVRAHVTYLNSSKEKLLIQCPGMWTAHQDEVTIPTGESQSLILAVSRGYWMTDIYRGIELRQRVLVEVRLLDKAGHLLSDKVFSFELAFGNDRFPKCKEI